MNTKVRVCIGYVVGGEPLSLPDGEYELLASGLLVKPEPKCGVCKDTGTYCVGTSGLVEDGNAPLFERCDCDAAYLAAAPVAPEGQQDGRILSLLKEARATLEMWKDVAPAVSLCSDIDKAIGEPVTAPIAQPGLRPFNPYTGRRRDQRDIDSDPMGILLVHPDEPLRAAIVPQPQQGATLAAWARFSEPGDSEWAKGYDAARSYVRMQLASAPASPAAAEVTGVIADYAELRRRCDDTSATYDYVSLTRAELRTMIDRLEELEGAKMQLKGEMK